MDSTTPLLGAATVTALGYITYKNAVQSCIDEAIQLANNVPLNQSVEMNADHPIPGETPIRRSVIAKDQLVDRCWSDVSTLYDNFMRGVRLFPNRPCLGARPINPSNGEAGPYVWQTYAQVAKRMTAFGSGISRIADLHPGSLIGIYSINRPEWVITEQACNAYSMVAVPLYDTLGASAVEYIVNQAGITVTCCEPKVLDTLLSAAAKCPTLRVVVVYGTPTQGQRSLAKKNHVELYAMEEVEEVGRKPGATLEHVPPSADSLATICYTSGTTGNPKGAMLSHNNLVANVAAVKIQVPGLMSESDVHISYLPLAHMFERLVTTGLYGHGAAVGFYQGDVLKLVDDIGVLRPTIFPSVPRLLNRLYDRVIATIESTGGLKAALFRAGYRAKLENLEKYGALEHPLWDRLVFGKIRARLGGRVRIIFTGSAPIAPHVMSFLRICFCCHVFEGYGQTEATACVSATLYGDTSTGHVGPPAPSAEIKLVDVPEMNYFSTDKPYPRGEVCVRGPTVFLGYYRNEEKTKEALDKDGWLHSGDIGAWLPNGALKIIDRKKNILKLSQGEYVAPEKLENIAARSKFIAQSFIHGDSMQNYLVAVVVPDPETADLWKQENDMPQASLSELCRSDTFKKVVLDDMHAALKQEKCKGFEFPRVLHLESEPFSVDNNLLTPTFKLKRIQCRQKYETILQKLYEQPTGGKSKAKL